MKMVLSLKIKRVIFLLIFAFILTGCAAGNYRLRLKQNSLGLKMSDEAKVGLATSRYIELKYKVLDDKKLNTKINRIGQRLAQYSGRPLIGYQFKILDADEYNAMSLPDGRVYIFKKLIELAGSDENIAAVLGHEIGHVSRSHVMKRLYAMKDYQAWMFALTVGLSAATRHLESSASARAESSRLLRLGAQVCQMILYSGYSQSAELEADRSAMLYMNWAGYDPRAFITMLKKLKETEKPQKEKEGLLRTHPPTSVRIEKAEEFLKVLPEVLANQKIKASYIGVQFGWNYDKENPVIINIIDNSPADKAGLKLTDKLLEINKHKMTNFRCRGDFELLMRDTIRNEFKKGKCNILIKRGSHSRLIGIKPEKIYQDPEVLLDIHQYQRKQISH